MRSMADVYIVTFSVIGILISFPGLAAALNLLLPATTERAYQRLAQTPVKSLILGLPITFAIIVWVLITANIPFGPVQFLAFVGAMIGMGLNSIGAAGLARLMGERIGDLTGTGTDLLNLIRGAVIYELACLFPLVGWFVLFPILVIMTVGAASFAMLRWVPRPKAAAQTSTMDITAVSDSTGQMNRLGNI